MVAETSGVSRGLVNICTMGLCPDIQATFYYRTYNTDELMDYTKASVGAAIATVFRMPWSFWQAILMHLTI